MIAGGLENPEDIIPQAIALATKEKPYVELTTEGKQWLIDEFPKLGIIINEVFQEEWRWATEDD
jgi:hypothetical protein